MGLLSSKYRGQYASTRGRFMYQWKKVGKERKKEEIQTNGFINVDKTDLPQMHGMLLLLQLVGSSFQIWVQLLLLSLSTKPPHYKPGEPGVWGSLSSTANVREPRLGLRSASAAAAPPPGGIPARGRRGPPREPCAPQAGSAQREAVLARRLLGGRPAAATPPAAAMLGARGGHGCERPESAGGRAGRAGHLLEVRPGLYLGGAAAVAEPGLLREAGITAVLAVDSEEPDLTAGAGTEGLRRLFVRALDEPETDLLSHLDRCAAFIGQARAEGRAVLVHCHAGVSRSVAVVTAFMMKTDQLTFEKAYESLQTIKPEAKMNEGFEWQLKLYQAMGYEVDTSSAIYKQYRLQKVTEKYPELQNLPQELFAVDPTTISQGLKDGILYKCRKCRRSLFRSSSILDHNEGSGPIAFAHKRVTPSFTLTTGSQAQCTSYFIEPVQWMESALLGVMDGQNATHGVPGWLRWLKICLWLRS
uniref:Dual specificity protein phosphatase 12 n=1 Tax=Canis lupus familiaris TaxID=9615 RepID=A0A8C0YVU5_CANLF